MAPLAHCVKTAPQTPLQPKLRRSKYVASLGVYRHCSITSSGAQHIAADATTGHQQGPPFSRRLNIAQLLLSSPTDSAVPRAPSAFDDPDHMLSSQASRRQLHFLVGASAVSILSRSDAAVSASSDPSYTTFSNPAQRYQLAVPLSWEKKDKAGADVLFEDPDKRSTSVGITVNPVRVRDIKDFGTLQDVGEKLLAVEKAKESTLSVDMVTQQVRETPQGVTFYEFEYELDSTRGRKRIFNTVTINSSKLYILNGTAKCKSDGCGEDLQDTLSILRAVAGSLEVQS